MIANQIELRVREWFQKFALNLRFQVSEFVLPSFTRYSENMFEEAEENEKRKFKSGHNW